MKLPSDANIFYSVVYLIDKEKEEVYYLFKDRPQVHWIHKKYVGWGGKLEKGESPEEGLLREVEEELGLVLEKEKLIKQGEFYDGFGGYIYVFKYYLEERLEEKIIEGEGEAVYKSITFCRENPNSIPLTNRYFESIVLESDYTFLMDFRERK